jgi:hypothetical protein
MKTTKNYLILSFAMILAAVTSTFANGIEKINGQPAVNTGIRHQVNVIVTIDKPLCNTYLVEIRDGHGQLVAPAQRFTPGITKYTFSERGPAEGVRIARLVIADYPHHFVCENELFTTPAIIVGKFLNGQTYRFDLFPSLQPIKE